ncbi:helix-turn-helix domain-containing protein [Loktanella sp. M215]|uniref:helix-turn-helix domain-containing protein n=1 Tax=Loktanella sp. M215 TaxID=2675431 RepID=UPI001F1FA0BD|nr:helix-turn-helix transcriptional regulator [Loktanella sp. M215]MCF7700526.1 helix-turn-helix domain-containing protein [Loktanella sp. M215]
MIEKKVSGRFADIAHRLRAVRAYYGYSSIEYAQQADVNPKSYSQWESGDHRISIDGAILLRERYGISLDFIYLGSVDTLPAKIANAVSSSPLLKNSNASTVNPD